MKLYIGNLAYSARERDVRAMLEEFGTVESLDWLVHSDTGQCRGFCFAEMNNSSADAAIKALNGQEFMGRNLKVNEARSPKGKRKRRFW